MKRIGRLIKVSLMGLLLAAVPSAPSHAITAAPALAVPPQLAIAEIKITGDEFIIIQNNGSTGITDLSQYRLESYNNVNPLASGASSSAQQLPAVNLAAGQLVSLSTTARPTCGASVAGKLNLSLTDSGGFLQIVQMVPTTTGGISHLPGDAVSWSSSANAGQIPGLPSNSKAPLSLYYRYQINGPSYGWQLADQDTANPCQLNVTIGAGTVTSQQNLSSAGLLSASDSAPAKIISLSDSSVGLANDRNLPLADIGLIIPEITELLPNPIGAGNDTTKEYVELYNPNNQTFDLSNFQLQAGTASVHTYIFPEGAMLPGKAFSAYYATATGLSLSNSGGRVSLLDPSGNELIASDAYGSAKDGQAWALANGIWYWTSTVTPAASNVIVQPVNTSVKMVASTSAKTAVTKTAKTTKTKATTSKMAKSKKPKTVTPPSNLSVAATAASLPERPIHPGVLALVAGVALLYGAYEYRTDLSNQLHKFGKQLAARFSNRR